MKDFFLHAANYFFFAFHSLLILFNLFGWLHPKTQKLNLITLLLTFGSWGILGIFYGWGYCFLTDWHYDILRQLGRTDLPSSYIAFLVEELSGWLPEADLVNNLTVGLAGVALLASLYVNLRNRLQKRRS